jgi:hypothetical protein
MATTFTDEVIQVSLALDYGAGSVARMAAILVSGMVAAVSTAFYSLWLFTRFSPATVVLASNAIGAAALGWYVAEPTFPLAVVVSAVAGLAMTLTGSGLAPSMRGLFSGVATSTVSTIVETARNGAILIGPPAAGFAAGAIGLRAVAAAAAVTMLVGGAIVTAAITTVREDVTTEFDASSVPRFRVRDITELVLAVGRPLFFAAVLAGVAALVTLNVVLVSFARQDVHMTAGEFGIAVTCLSVGLVIGPALARLALKREHSRSGVGAWTVAMSTSILLLVVIPTVWAVFVLLFVMGVCNGVRNAELRTVVYDAISSDRMTGLYPVYAGSLQAAALVGFIATLAASAFLPRSGIIVAGSVCALATGVIIMVSELRGEWVGRKK